MPKKIIAIFIILIILISIGAFSHAASDDLKLVINGKVIECDVNPMIINGRTMVPVRVLFDNFGADVLWNASLRQVVISTAASVIIFTIDSKTAYIDGVGRTVDVAPTIVDGRTLVPIRFISEVLHYDVVWNGSNRTVYVTHKSVQENDNHTSNPDTDTSDDTVSNIKLKKITAVEDDDVCVVTVSLSEKTEPKTMKLSSPTRLVFDFYNVNQTCKDSEVLFENSSVKEIRWANHPDFTRIVVETSSETSYSLKYTSDSCIITVNKTEYTDTDNESDTSQKDTSDSPAVIPVINGNAPIVVVDAGHGGYDSGAIGRDADGNVVVYEKDANFNIALRLEKKLKNSGINVIMTRSSDMALGDTIMADLVGRAEIANKSNADLFISIHNNAFTDPEATGTSVLYAGLSNNGDYGISSQELAENILTPLVKATGLKDRGIVRSPEMVVLKRTVMPAVLIECAFVSSYTDQKVLTNEKKLDDIADAIYEGIVISLHKMGRIK